MHLATVHSGAVTGIEALPVVIEADVSRSGDPQMVIVGLPDASVREARDRVQTAISNSGYEPFRGRITVNLAPADLKKDGTLFDLPIALGVLLASGEGEPRRPRSSAPGERELPRAVPLDRDSTAVVGELSLAGDVRPVRGALPLAVSLRGCGFRTLLVPEANAAEAAVVSGLAVYGVRNLRHAMDLMTGEDRGATAPVRVNTADVLDAPADDGRDFIDVRGQEAAKRAIEVAVAGGHNILMMGPPGTGKSMLARCIPSILPRMSLDESLELTKIHSIAGMLPPDVPLLRTRAFRSPHHTVSDVGLIGGGAHPSPGEVTLAHNGVLFLDELPEFSRSVLEVLRQPLEDGFVSISRAAGSARFPARFMLVAAMNPCPCGYLGDPNRPCRCTPTQTQRYRSRISGPLLDRIDLQITVAAGGLRDMQSMPKGMSSAQMRENVLRARRIQEERFAGRRAGARANGAMARRDIERFCHMDAECLRAMNFAINELKFSPRAHDRILKVARTIADLAGRAGIAACDIMEAVNYRSLDRSVWT